MFQIGVFLKPIVGGTFCIDLHSAGFSFCLVREKRIGELHRKEMEL